MKAKHERKKEKKGKNFLVRLDYLDREALEGSAKKLRVSEQEIIRRSLRAFADERWGYLIND